MATPSQPPKPMPELRDLLSKVLSRRAERLQHKQRLLSETLDAEPSSAAPSESSTSTKPDAQPQTFSESLLSRLTDRPENSSGSDSDFLRQLLAVEEAENALLLDELLNDSWPEMTEYEMMLEDQAFGTPPKMGEDGTKPTS